MKTLVLLSSIVLLAGCGSSEITTPPKKPALDPGLTIRVRDIMDTTTAPGRADWHIFVLLSGPYTALNGIGLEGTIGLNDVRLGHNILCIGVGADSVGQRLVSVLAVADTTTSNLTPDATAAAITDAWYGGNHTLPAGWAALTFAPQDAWNSQQFLAGHGQTLGDPIKWGFDWTDAGTTTFYERTDSDPACSR